jgi:hypothetical protein
MASKVLHKVNHVGILARVRVDRRVLDGHLVTAFPV